MSYLHINSSFDAINFIFSMTQHDLSNLSAKLYFRMKDNNYMRRYIYTMDDPNVLRLTSYLHRLLSYITETSLDVNYNAFCTAVQNFMKTFNVISKLQPYP